MLNSHRLIIQQHRHFLLRCFVSSTKTSSDMFVFFILEQTKDTTQPPHPTTGNDGVKVLTQSNSHRPLVSVSPNRSRFSRDLSHTSQKHSNSCSTIYVDDSTVSQPNWKAMIKCVSIAIHSHILHRKSNKTMNIFDEKLHPLSVSVVLHSISWANDSFNRKIQYRLIMIINCPNRRLSIDF